MAAEAEMISAMAMNSRFERHFVPVIETLIHRHSTLTSPPSNPDSPTLTRPKVATSPVAQKTEDTEMSQKVTELSQRLKDLEGEAAQNAVDMSQGAVEMSEMSNKVTAT